MEGESIEASLLSEGENLKRDDVVAEIDGALKSGATPRMIRFILSCLSGVPYVGGLIGASGNAWSEAEQGKFNQILVAWIKIQEKEIEDFGRTMSEIVTRIDLNDKKTEERIRSTEYLSLIRKAFRESIASESEEKRTFLRNLLINAASCSLCSDDVVKMFIDWINRYSEAHFKVIRAVYKQKGATRGDIWREIDGTDVREDSAEADLFKLLVHELTVGRVMRQYREKDYQGNFLKVNPQRNRSSRSKIMTSAFDDGKEYELTELGRQFVHYTMNEVVQKIEYSI